MKFKGVGVALVTPFDENGKIDEVALGNLVDDVIVGGVDYLVALGTTSEAATMSEAERMEVLRLILEKNNKRVPVMVGIGGNNTAEVVKKLQEFPYAVACDAVLSVVPYYNKPSQEGMYQHFKAIGECSPLPVFLYNVPGRTATNLSASTVVRLSNDCPNIAGIKEASGNFAQISEILKFKRHDFTVVSGDDGITLPLMAIGVEGVISVIANACSRDFSTMVHLAQTGKFSEAAEIHLQLSELFQALFAEGNPAGIKAALHIKGIIRNNRLRLPLIPVTPALYDRLRLLLGY